MDDHQEMPGTLQHQAILRAIVSHYEADPRVRAVIVFGSLGRGNWDPDSDIDLDIIIANSISGGVAGELRSMCAALEPLGERAVLILPDSEDEGDVILESLMSISARYHPLETTSAHILESMLILHGNLDREVIVAAGEANRTEELRPPVLILDEFLVNAVWAQAYRQRGFTWLGLELLERMRSLLAELFASTRGSFRKYRFFDLEASPYLQQRLAGTLPEASMESARACLDRLLDLMEQELDCLSNGQARLNASQRAVLERLKRGALA